MLGVQCTADRLGRGRRSLVRRVPTLGVAIFALLLVSVHLAVGSLPWWAASAADAVASPLGQRGKLHAGNGWLEERNGLIVVHLKGTPTEIGAQHARLLGEQAQIMATAMVPGGQPSSQSTGEAGPQGNGLPDQAEALMRSDVIPTLLRQIPARYIDEMKGFMRAAGGGDAVEAIVPLVLGNTAHDLGLVFGVGGGPEQAGRETAGAAGACTQFAAWGSATTDGNLIHGRNLDYLGLHELGRIAVVAVYEPTGYYPFIAVTYPGLFGVMQGMNIHGISISMTYSLARPPHVSIDGIPYMFLLRRVLEEAATLDEAISIIEKGPRTVGLTILVADGKIPAARVVEVSASRCVVREASTQTIWATNRYETAAMKQVQMPGWLSSEQRDRRLRAALGMPSSGMAQASSVLPLDVPEAVELLRDRSTDGSLAGRINNPGTIISAVFAPSVLRMWAAIVPERGTAADGCFHAFDLRAELGLPPLAAAVAAPANDIPALEAPSDSEQAAWQVLVEAAYRQEVGDLPQAEALARQALARCPHSEAALLILGKALYQQGKDEEAGARLEELVRLPQVHEPHNLLEAWYTLGLIAERRGQPAQAVAAFQAALAVPLPKEDVSVGDPLQAKAAEALGRWAGGGKIQAGTQKP